MKVSLCMIVRNEEAVLKRCLESIRGAVDEMVVVDTGSTDRTKEIAKECGAKVFSLPWEDDFAAARNFAFSKGKGDFLLWLDADDIVPAESLEKLKILFRRDTDADVFMLPYRVAFAEDGSCTMEYERERILRRGPDCVWKGRVHEVIVPYGKVVHVDIPIEHRPGDKTGQQGRNLRILEKMKADGALSPRDSYYYGRELYAHGRCEEAEKVLHEYLFSDGWIEDKKQAYFLLSQCAARRGDRTKRLQWLLDSMRLDTPSATLCCRLGDFYREEGAIQTAVFWYQAARNVPMEKQGFCYPEDHGFFPCIWLCVCYDRLGNTAEAKKWNEAAAEFHPTHPSVLYNRAYLEGREEATH